MNHLLNSWIKLLGLSDWNITIKNNCKKSELVSKDSDGEIEIIEPKRIGQIRIIKEPSRPEEEVLIHELLHAKLCLLDTDENTIQSRLLHQYIDDFARLLYKLKQGGK